MTPDLDDALIQALREDGRATYRQLATRLGVPRSLVSTRVRALLDSGEMRIVAAADPAFVGDRALAHVSITGQGDLTGLTEGLCARPEIPLVSATSGPVDLVAEIRATDQTALRETLCWIRGLPGADTVRVNLYTDVIRGTFASHFTGEVTVDDIDAALIEQLNVDGRTSYRDLAERVRLSQTAVRARVHRMLQARILKISAVVRQDAGSARVKVGVGLNLGGDESSVLTTLADSPETEFTALTLGGYDLIATVSGGSPPELFARLERLRALDAVHRMTTWFHLHTLKEDYGRSVSSLSSLRS
ncbi:Lrp/AsnC family transcriptional regulator [Auritidibacter ignavus]|uniref:Lrp/AsnC family transcriptional regulator n=1 Tax=Auritidibacter ignavus TaxID=678932 RepID=UPI002FE4FE38